MNDLTPEPPKKSATDSLPDTELEHLKTHYQETHPQQIKWYQHPAVQMLTSTLTFALISSIIISLFILFSDQLGVFIDARMVVTARITDNVLLDSAKRLRTNSESLSANERSMYVELAQHLENAASELDGTAGQFILKSRTQSAPEWLQMAMAEYTRQNKLGTYSNRILQYTSSISNNSINTLPPIDIAWSSHFVNWIMQKSNIAGTNNAQPSSWLIWGNPITELKHGAIGVFKLTQPHKPEMVGFFLVETKNYAIILMGDILSAVNIVAFPKSQLLGYRWPSK